MKAVLNDTNSWEGGITLAVSYREAVTIRNALNYAVERIADSLLGQAGQAIQPALDELLGYTPDNSPAVPRVDLVAAVARAQYVAAVYADDASAADAAATVLFTAHHGYTPQDIPTPSYDWSTFTERLCREVEAELQQAIAERDTAEPGQGGG